MVKELVFHLGDQKTGSTSIQLALSGQDFDAQGRSIYSSATLNHNPVAVALKPGAPRFSRLKAFAPLLRDYWRNGSDVGVISAEIFQEVDPVQLKRAIDTYLFPFRHKVRLITYLRPHAESVLARFAEATKQGTETGDLTSYVERTRGGPEFTYFPRLTRWREVFGDRFTVRPYLRSALRNGDVVSDFLDFALSGTPFDPPARRPNNVTLGIEDLMMLREFQLKMQNNAALLPFARRIGWNLALVLGEQPPASSTPLRLHRELVDHLHQLYGEDARQVDAAFFAGEPMTGAWETARASAVALPPDWKAESYFDEGALQQIHFWAEICIMMLEGDPANHLAHFRALQVEMLKLRTQPDAAH